MRCIISTQMMCKVPPWDLDKQLPTLSNEKEHDRNTFFIPIHNGTFIVAICSVHIHCRWTVIRQQVTIHINTR